MINITSENKTVLVEITMSSINWSTVFKGERSTELDAVLLRNQLKKDLQEKISQIRKKAYEDGWKDKSKKVKKHTHFYGGISSDLTGF